MKYCLHAIFLLLVLCVALSAQVPLNTAVQILKAEDGRRYDKTLIDLMKNTNPEVRARAALAAGRIGEEKAVSDLVVLLADRSAAVRTAAVFALGETESIKGADAI